ncbi:hypothetical protein Scel_02880 [Streptomyces cellostaticus]|nr:hypothetical protein Scel_02880 [Streptomyces cellostaticus]
MGVHGGLDQLVLGLEVVVDVAEGDVAGPGDVREGGLLHALLMEDLDGGCDQAFTLAAPAGAGGGSGRRAGF